MDNQKEKLLEEVKTMNPTQLVTTLEKYITMRYCAQDTLERVKHYAGAVDQVRMLTVLLVGYDEIVNAVKMKLVSMIQNKSSVASTDAKK